MKLSHSIAVLSVIAVALIVSFAALSMFGNRMPNPSSLPPVPLPCNQSETTTDCAALMQMQPQPQPTQVSTATTTFSSSILGVAFEYVPSDFDDPVDEEVTTQYLDLYDNSGPQYKEYAEQSVGGVLFRADNNVSSTIAKEGCSDNLIAYFGQPLSDICTTQSFVNTCYENVKVEQCSIERSANGVVYAHVKVLGYYPEIGLAPSDRWFAAIARAQASSQDLEQEAIIFPTRSSVFPGATMYLTLSNPYPEPTAITVPNPQELETMAQTLRYVPTSSK